MVRERLGVQVPHVGQPRVELGPHARTVRVLQHAVLAPLRPVAQRPLLLCVVLVVSVVVLVLVLLVLVPLVVLVVVLLVRLLCLR